MKLLEDERAENPLEVGYYVLIVLLAMAFLMMSIGAFMDSFDAELARQIINHPLSTWGTGVMATYRGYEHYVYSVPSIFIVIILIWGVHAVIRKHTYTTAQNQTYNNPDEF